MKKSQGALGFLLALFGGFWILIWSPVIQGAAPAAGQNWSIENIGFAVVTLGFGALCIAFGLLAFVKSILNR